MTSSQREIALAVATVFVAVFAGTFVWGRKRYETYRDIRGERKAIETIVAADREMIAMKDETEAELAARRDVLMVFPEGRDMSSYWMSRIESIADKTGVKLIKRVARREVQKGDMFEIPIEFTEWEADLTSLVRFLYEIQSAGGMLDVRELLVRPRGGDVLKGRCNVYCIYRREEASGDSG